MSNYPEKDYLLSVVVPTRNRSRLLLETVKRLVEQCEDYPQDVELIVADNSSEDTTKQNLINIDAGDLNHEDRSYSRQ